MIEIPEPPDTAACSSCASPLRWLWSARTGAWVSFATEPTDNRLLRVHECPPRGVDRLPTWRDPATGPKAAPDSPAKAEALAAAHAAARRAGGAP